MSGFMSSPRCLGRRVVVLLDQADDVNRNRHDGSSVCQTVGQHGWRPGDSAPHLVDQWLNSADQFGDRGKRSRGVVEAAPGLDAAGVVRQVLVLARAHANRPHSE